MPASPLLRRAVQAALLGARRTGGLADPTLLGCRRGRRLRANSRVGVEPAALDAALRAAPRPPRGHAGRALARGRRSRDGDDRPAARPPHRPRRQRQGPRGRLGRREARAACFAVDCGGDVRVGGDATTSRLRGTARHAAASRDAAVATSGIDRRVWRRPDGSYAHHLLDPGTGEPAWTGLISATAIAATALEAEALAKAALLQRAARRADDPGARAAGSSSATTAARRSSSRWRWPHDARPDGLRLVARQPRVRARRAGADHALGRRRAGDGRQGVPEARAGAQADGAARARRARRADRDRRARDHAARRPLAASRAGRDRGAVRDGLPARLHRARDRRRATSPPRSGSPSSARKRIGAKLWRKLHRATIAVYVLAVVHTLGAGTDA